MRVALLLAVMFGAVSTATGAQAGQAGSQLAPTTALARLQADFPGARVYRQGQRITRIYGVPVAFGIDPEAAAEEFRWNCAEALSVPPGELEPAGLIPGETYTQPLMYDHETGQYKFTLVKYMQHKDGIPIFRADLRLLVRNQPHHPLVLVVSSLRDTSGFTRDQSAGPLRADLGRQAALAFAPSLVNFSEPEMVIWAGVGDVEVEPVLAICFVADNASPGSSAEESWLLVVDAATGEILYKEDRIIFEDVVGNVSGLATEAPKADYCAPEVLMAMPYAMVSIQDGNSAQADEYGDFVISNGGSSEVTVESPVRGEYFRVYNQAGDDTVLEMQVTPPGPANFTHNQANADEYIRAEINGYVQANIVRDFALSYNPDYPVISTQTDFPVHVNQVGGLCPGNAWYDYESINFCASGDEHPNTAYASIVHHEYGHHLVQSAGSGQDQYGEGMSDSIGMLIADDPVLAYGLSGDCDQGMRSADNDMQYPCYGEAHHCGQLLSGCIWSTRNELAVTCPTDYLDILSDLTVNSIMLHSGNEITSQITIDFLTLDDDDDDIGNGTPHRDEICAGFGAHGMNCPELEIGLRVTPADNFITLGPSGGPFTPDSFTYVVENQGPDPIDYGVANTQPWVTITNDSGPLGVGDTADVIVSINTNANSLDEGRYEDTISFTNETDHIGDTTRIVALNVGTFGTLYGVHYDTGDLYTISQTDASLTLVGNTGLTLGSLESNLNDSGPFYGFTCGSSATFYSIDPNTAASTTIGSLGLDFVIEGGLAFSPGGIAYGVASGDLNHLEVFTIDVATGAGTTVAVLSDGPHDVNGLAWRSDGMLVGLDRESNALIEIDPSSGNVSTIATLAIAGVGAASGMAATGDAGYIATGCTYDSGSIVYPGTNSLYYVDLYTGDHMLIGSFEPTITGIGISGLALLSSGPCFGDLDDDNDIDLADLAQLLANYGTTSGASYADGDLDDDGDVDLADLAALLAVYGTICE